MTTNLVMQVGALDIIGGLIIINICLMVLLFALLVVVIITSRRRKYYDRIRLASPKISGPPGKAVSDVLRWIARIVIALLIIAALVLLLFYLAKLGVTLISPVAKGNQSNMINLTNNSGLLAKSNISEKPINKSKTGINLTVDSTNTTLLPAAEAVTLMGKMRDFALTYAGYVIVGFIILIILISVLGGRKQD
jgi:hypothetical protein